MAKNLVFMFCCLLVASGTAAHGLDEAYGDRKDYYPPGPTDPHHSPRHSHKAPSCTPTPSHGGRTVSPLPTTPSPPNGGGSYYPPTPSIGTTPPTVTPTPAVPLPPISTPPTPFVPFVPAPPSITPMPFDPNIPPFFNGTSDYWRTHPGAIWALFGFWCPMVRLFGPAAAVPFGRDLSVPEALTNTRKDGVGALYREGTASLLNSMVNSRFLFTTQQVKDAFGSALRSGERAAAAQAELFKKANDGHVKH